MTDAPRDLVEAATAVRDNAVAPFETDAVFTFDFGGGGLDMDVALDSSCSVQLAADMPWSAFTASCFPGDLNRYLDRANSGWTSPAPQ